MFTTFFKIKPKSLLSIFIITHVCFLSQAHASKVAIIIDDMGYRATDQKALSLPGDITYSFLPHTTYGKKLAVQANRHKHDVLIHIPMESTNRKTLGPGALTSNMNAQAYNQSLAKSLAEIPFAIGINNHMGSYLTELYKPMTWTMEFLKQNNLVFLDSKTSANSKAEQAAIDYGVPVKSRHIFLDNELSEPYISHQFKQLVQYSQRNEIAIAIAHPHPETIAILTKLIPTLESQGIELVPLSTLYPAPVTKKIARLNEEDSPSLKESFINENLTVEGSNK